MGASFIRREIVYNVKASKILELNPDHELFKAFSSIKEQDDLVKKYASLLYDEAVLLEGR